MRIGAFHLSYCSNIHPGESWEETFANLRTYIPQVRHHLGVEGAFGIGLRLSHAASLTLAQAEPMQAFQRWLASADAYVFTLNGFPYGNFHHTVVKDQVHQPDWTTAARRDYTIRSFQILAQLLPEGGRGGISTSPISYRHWFADQQAKEAAMAVATQHLLEVVAELARIESATGKWLHLDIEPEPDGILENSDEVLWLFRAWLLPQGIPWLAQQLEVSAEEAEAMIRRYLQVCYDVCHFAIVYEEPAETFQKWEAAGIQVGKIQLSAALQVHLTSDRSDIKSQLLPFAESTYLHQVVGRKDQDTLISYSDLPHALDSIQAAQEQEWRIHFHVPLFVKEYGQFFSTQAQIERVLDYLRQNPSLCEHLEVETYTWEVLPPDMQVKLDESISRELDWVMKRL